MRMPSPGEDFGRYRIERELGRGAMGIVYAARDTSLDREVALKLITPQWAEDPEYRARFEREARSLSRVDSPHVVAVHDYGELDGSLYLVTQIVPDGDLHQLVAREGALAPAVALDLAEQVLGGLATAHAVGVVHRDVKPSNILLRRREGRLEAVLCDFGIATGPEGDVTRTGALVGSFPYMAPERHQGEQADATADVYSVGCLLWQLLTGSAPYVGSDVEVAMAHLQAPLPQLPPSDDFARAINLVLLRALAKDAGERYPSARAMRSDLMTAAPLARGVLQLPDTTSIRHVIVPGVVAAGAATGAGAASSSRRRRAIPAVVAAVVAVVALAVGTSVAVTSGSDGTANPDGTSGAAGGTAPTTGLGGVAGDPPAATSPDPDNRTTSPRGGRDRETRTDGARGSQGRQGPQGSRGGGSSTTQPSGGGSNPGVSDPGVSDPDGDGGTGGGGAGGGGNSGGGNSGGGNGGGGNGGSGGGGNGGARDRDTPTPAPTPPPKTFRCWNGAETYGYGECPALSGRAGLEWVYSNHYGCTLDPTVGGPRLTILTCPRRTQHGAGQIRYTLWKSVALADEYFAQQHGRGGTSWNGDWGRQWVRQTNSELSHQRTFVYSAEPVSAVITGVNRQAMDQVVGTVRFSLPSSLRGNPM